MRRATRAIVALSLLVAATAGTGEPAGAHFCSSPLQVPVGRPVTFTVGVPAEDVAVTRVDIELPDGFEFHRAAEFAQWKVERHGDLLRFTGGTIRLFMCAFFTIAGEVPEKATLVVPFITYGADGTMIREFRSKVLNHADAAQLVYAGTTPGAEAQEPAEEEQPVLAIAGWALIGLGAAGAVVLAWRRRSKSG